MSYEAVTELLGGGRLVIVSNRAPFEMHRRSDGVRFVPTVGGLVSAFTAAFRAARSGLWKMRVTGGVDKVKAGT